MKPNSLRQAALVAAIALLAGCAKEQSAAAADSAAAVRDADFNRSKYGDSAAYSRDSALADSILKANAANPRP